MFGIVVESISQPIVIVNLLGLVESSSERAIDHAPATRAQADMKLLLFWDFAWDRQTQRRVSTWQGPYSIVTWSSWSCPIRDLGLLMPGS